MGQSSEKVGLPTVKIGLESKFPDSSRRDDDPGDVGERTCAFLRTRYPARTAENVAADLRHWQADTITKMLERQSTPSGRLLLALTLAYGPDFLAAVLDPVPAWLDRAHRRETAAALDAEIAALQRRRESLR